MRLPSSSSSGGHLSRWQRAVARSRTYVCTHDANDDTMSRSLRVCIPQLGDVSPVVMSPRRSGKCTGHAVVNDVMSRSSSKCGVWSVHCRSLNSMRQSRSRCVECATAAFTLNDSPSVSKGKPAVSTASGNVATMHVRREIRSQFYRCSQIYPSPQRDPRRFS